MNQTSSLIRYLKRPEKRSKERDSDLERLQLEMLRVQQGVWHRKKRVIVLFEGFDAAGKGGAIRAMTQNLDPRGIQVHPIGPPTADEQGRHYLYRFWEKLPAPGTIAVFDRSWYGRVLVEKVEKLCPRERVRDAYEEIRWFERMLVDDGVEVIKFFLAIHPEEQLRRFKARLDDPFKQWKISEADVRARARWDGYVDAAETMLSRTHFKKAPWHLVEADDKPFARRKVLKTVTRELKAHRIWLEKEARGRDVKALRKELAQLEKKH
jgi:polyphosphate kinase 2 (PPK2 family)